jgi:glycerophosphoryl diester phosphodiesterase
MWVIAHRGASAVAPENTLAAFRRALEMGAGFIETDLQLTRDARIVALHDDTLNRTTNGSGAVSAKTLEQVRQLDAGAWFGRRRRAKGTPKGAAGSFAGERVPTIEEVLALGLERDVGLYLESKVAGHRGAEHVLVEALRAAGGVRRSVVMSFDTGVLKQVRRLDPLIVTGYLYETGAGSTSSPRQRPPRGALARALDAGARQLLPRADRVTAKLVTEAHQNDLKVVVWTVNDPKEMRRVITAGVDGIITNRPDVLVKLLGRT